MGQYHLNMRLNMGIPNRELSPCQRCSRLDCITAQRNGIEPDPASMVGICPQDCLHCLYMWRFDQNDALLGNPEGGLIVESWHK